MFSIFWPGYIACRILALPNHGLNPGLWQWSMGLTTESPGNSQLILYVASTPKQTEIFIDNKQTKQNLSGFIPKNS